MSLLHRNGAGCKLEAQAAFWPLCHHVEPMVRSSLEELEEW